jgi:allantoinase
LIDVHLHFNEPGRTDWEGAETGSRALAAGGGTTFFDMPLNSTPCTVTAREFDRKRHALERVSIADFGLWGGLVPGHVGEMAAMAERGAVGFKAFMCDSGLPEFPRVDDDTLRTGMVEARRLGLPVAVHAESEEMTRALALRRAGRGAREFLDSRPLAAELEAIARALALAAETGAALHLVHVSAGRGVALAAEARARGVDVSVETCPHYLTFTADDLERLGVTAKCAPPLRSAEHQRELWSALSDGSVDLVASDHSPAPPDLKPDGDFVAAWGGIAGVQSTLAALVTEGHRTRGMTLARISAVVATTPARRFKIAGKGAVAIGFDADVSLVDVDEAFVLRREDLLQRHRMSPYVGMAMHGRVRRTIRRGETLWMDGKIVATGGGRFVRPA